MRFVNGEKWSTCRKLDKVFIKYFSPCLSEAGNGITGLKIGYIVEN